jgi:hypothetical protein
VCEGFPYETHPVYAKPSKAKAFGDVGAADCASAVLDTCQAAATAARETPCVPALVAGHAACSPAQFGVHFRRAAAKHCAKHAGSATGVEPSMPETKDAAAGPTPEQILAPLKATALPPSVPARPAAAALAAVAVPALLPQSALPMMPKAPLPAAAPAQTPPDKKDSDWCKGTGGYYGYTAAWVSERSL